MRRIVCRAPWSAVAVTEQVLTTTTSASRDGASIAAARAQVLLEAQRVRLVDAAAEGDDGVLHVEPSVRAHERVQPFVAAACSTFSASFFL